MKYDLESFPKTPGVYFWYCDGEGVEKLGIDKTKLTKKQDLYLIYIGKINNSLRQRLKWHWDSKVPANQKTTDPKKFMLSTFRHSLGALLFEYNKGDELDAFMQKHLDVDFIITKDKEETVYVENKLINETPYLPLNIRGNKNRDEFHKQLSAKRKSFKNKTIGYE